MDIHGVPNYEHRPSPLVSSNEQFLEVQVSVDESVDPRSIRVRSNCSGNLFQRPGDKRIVVGEAFGIRFYGGGAVSIVPGVQEHKEPIVEVVLIQVNPSKHMVTPNLLERLHL